MTEMTVAPRELRLVALNPSDLECEQKRLIAWCDRKEAEANVIITELDTNLALAQRAGFNTAPIRSAINREMKRFFFFQKLKAALEAGFYVVPNMAADVFAIRTKRNSPPSEVVTSTWKHSAVGKMPQKQLLAAGEGRYVSATRTLQVNDSFERDTKNHKGEATKETVYSAWSSDFVDEIDFPFTLARSEVMDATQRALALKVFDEVAAVPATRREDPMVIGRIYQANGRHVTFLIAWFLNTEDL